MTLVKEWHQHKGNVLDRVEEYDVIDCEVCRFNHIVPIPTESELEDVYRDEYYSQVIPNHVDERREDLDWWNGVFDAHFDFFESNLSSDGRRILDVGSGPGYFLQKGQERGWETLGIEPSVQALTYSRNLGLDVIEGFLDAKLASQIGYFHVVHMHEVLEHIVDPEQMLSLVYTLLHPGGIVCVIVPNDYNPLQQALRDSCGYQPWWLAPPHHVNYFNFTSLSTLVKHVGFEVLHETATFPMELFLLMGDNYIGNNQIGRAMHAKRKQLEVNMLKAGCSALWEKVYASLAELKVGREVVLYARRPWSE